MCGALLRYKKIDDTRGHSVRHTNQLALTLNPLLQQLYYDRLGVELTLCGSQAYCIRVWIAIMGTLSHTYTHSMYYIRLQYATMLGLGWVFLFSLSFMSRCIGIWDFVRYGLATVFIDSEWWTVTSVGDSFTRAVIIDFTVYVWVYVSAWRQSVATALACNTDMWRRVCWWWLGHAQWRYAGMPSVFPLTHAVQQWWICWGDWSKDKLIS